MSTLRLRRYWVNLHLLLAWFVGLIFVFQGLTGCVSLYRDEIDRFIHPELIITPPSSAPLNLDQVLALIQQAEPERYGVWTLELPSNNSTPLIAWFDKPRETIGEFYAPLMLAINPYTGDVLAKRFWGQTEVTWLLDLHSHWLQGQVGRDYLALTAIALAISVMSGIVLWWPGWRELIRRNHHAINHPVSALLQLHRSLGVMAAPGLLLMAVTGFYLANPAGVEKLTGTEGLGHGAEGPMVRSTGIQGNRHISLAEIVLIARGPFSQAQLRRLSTPLGDTGTYKINFRQSKEFNQRHPLTTVWIDRWSGQIRDVQNPQRFTTIQSLMSALWPLHTSELLGEWGRPLWTCLGLSPLLMYLSGVFRFIRRHRRKARHT